MGMGKKAVISDNEKSVPTMSNTITEEGYSVDGRQLNPNIEGTLANQTNNMIIHSTDETAIGTWIDGRTIYRKCYYISGSVTSTTTILDTSFLGTYEILNFGGGCYDTSDTGSNPIPTVSPGSAVYNRTVSYSSGNGLVLMLGSSMTSRTQNVNIIVEYVKAS